MALSVYDLPRYSLGILGRARNSLCRFLPQTKQYIATRLTSQFIKFFLSNFDGHVQINRKLVAIQRSRIFHWATLCQWCSFLVFLVLSREMEPGSIRVDQSEANGVTLDSETVPYFERDCTDSRSLPSPGDEVSFCAWVCAAKRSFFFVFLACTFCSWFWNGSEIPSLSESVWFSLSQSIVPRNILVCFGANGAWDDVVSSQDENTTGCHTKA